MKNALKMVLGLAIFSICLYCSADVRTELIAALKMRADMILAADNKLQVMVTMKKDKIIADGPNFYTEYSNYYILRKPFQIFDGELIVINHNYGSGLGCCAKNGLILMLDMGNDRNMSQLQRFSKENGCSVKLMSEAYYPDEIQEFIATKKSGNIFVLDCDGYRRDLKKVEYITKQQARARILAKLDSNRDKKTLSAEETGRIKLVRTVLLCMFNAQIDEVFKGGTTKIESDSLEHRMKLVEEENGDTLQWSRLNCSSSMVDAIDIDDFRLDFNTLSGKQVKVSAFGYYVMNSFMLKRSSMDMSPVAVNITRVSRDQRKEILQKCSDIRTGCKVRVFGVVVKSEFQDVFFAIGVEW